jgi:hypothetical protein
MDQAEAHAIEAALRHVRGGGRLAQSAHDASLTDIDAEYGDVVSVDEAVAVLRGA